MAVTEKQLQELERVIAAAPPGPYTPSGRPPNYFGFHYRFGGGIHQVGIGGDLLPSLVHFILAAADQLPELVTEVRRLQAENARLRNQVSDLKGSN